MLNHLKFHHIGVACKDIEKECENFETLGYSTNANCFIDELQKIKGKFIYAEKQPTLELLANLEENGPLDCWLKQGTKFYHFAYQSDDIEKDLEYLIKEKKAIIISPIKNAVYFKRICFIMLRNKTLIELVEI